MKKQKHKSKKEDISFPNIGPIIELKRKSTRQSLLVNRINESLSLKWAQTLQSFPIGILIVKKTNLEILFENEELLQIFQGMNNIGEYILNTLECKVIGQKKFNVPQKQTSIVLEKSVQLSGQFNTTLQKNQPSFYSVEQVLNLVKLGQMDRYLTKDDQIELSTQFQRGNEAFSEERNLIIKISTNYGENEFFIIIQDISLQTNYKKVETREKFIVKIIASISHELKTPLNSAQLFLQAIQEKDMIPADILENCIDPAKNSLRLQAYIIRDIIDFTQFSSGVIKYSFSDFNFTDIIQEIKDLFKMIFAHKKIGLHINAQKSIPNVLNSDFNRVMQIIVNILQNSVKFSNHGLVDIIIQGFDGYVMFSIKDQGNGIEQDNLRKIQSFLQNFTISRNISHQEEWQGLGLLVSQMNLLTLAPQNKQYLQITSKGKNQGVEVKFRIKTMSQASTQQFTQHPTFKRGSLASPKTVPDFTDGISGLLIITNAEINDLSMKNIPLINNSSVAQYYRRSILQENSDNFQNQQIETDLQIQDSDRSALGQCLMQLKQSHQPKFLSLERSLQRHNTLASKMIQRNDQKNQLDFHFNNIKFRCKCQRALSVDDDSFNQKALQVILGQMGFEMVLAYNGQQALDLFRNSKRCSPECHIFIFILMDCQMPVMDGWQATKRLRSMMKSHLLPFIPIIGLTAFNGSTEIEKCLEVGMQTVLIKPLQINDFKSALIKLYQFQV